MGSGNRSWVASVYLAALAFALLILVYGVIPSEFIGWFNKKYNDANLRKFVRDPIIVVWHLVTIAGFVVYSVQYQNFRVKRAKKAAEAETEDESAYGRPLKSEA